MQGRYRYGIIVARLLVSLVFLLNATGVVDQTEAARELVARGAPANIVPFLMLVGRSVELIGGLALIFGIFPACGCPRLNCISHTGDTGRPCILAC